jgi:hypothetical protein
MSQIARFSHEKCRNSEKSLTPFGLGRTLSSNPVYYVAMQFVDIVAWAFLSLLIGWIGFMLWSTYVWLREGFEHVSGRGQGFPPRGGDPW